MLFPTELGGGNDSRIAAIYRGDLCDMACNRPRLSFPARRNDAGGGNFRNPKRGVPRVFRQFPTALPCIMEPRRETIPAKRCVGCLRPVLRRGASASMPPLHPGGYARACVLLFLHLFFSPLSLRRISAQAIMPRRSRRRYSFVASYLMTASRRRCHVVRHGRAVMRYRMWRRFPWRHLPWASETRFGRLCAGLAHTVLSGCDFVKKKIEPRPCGAGSV